MSDDLDFDMEVVENDELNEMSADDASSSKKRAHSGAEESTTINSEHGKGTTDKKDEAVAAGRTVSSEKQAREEEETSSRLNNLPGDWPVRQIQEAAEVVGGSTPSTENEEYWGGGIPWATPTDITGLRGTTIAETEDMITEEGLGSASTHVLPAYSVLMTSRATIGACAVNTVPMTTNQGFQSLVPGDKLNTWYLLYRMLHEAPYLESLGAGSTFSEISKRVVEKVDIPVPSLPEQRKIASVLYAVDQAIQKTEEIIEQAYRVKRGLVQDLFHGKDKVYEDYKSTPVGEVPSHWSVTNIGAVVEMAQYGISESMSEDGMYPIFRMNNIENGYMVGEPMKYIDLDNREFEKYRVEKRDILFNRTNSLELVGKTGIFELEGDYVFASYLVRLRANEEVDPYYLNFYMNSFEGQNRMMDFATKGVSQANINANSIQQVKLPLPPKDEQQDIAAKIRAFDQEIGHHNEYAAQLKDLKKGLMQDLLTGEVRTADRAIKVLEEVQAHG